MSITLNGTTGLAGTNGSAGTPAVQGEDTNTGIFFPAADTVAVATAGAERLRVDSSGNVGIGVTPSAWKSNYRAGQFGTGGTVAARTDNSGVNFSSNWFEDSGGADRYINTAHATRYLQVSGAHSWFTAPSGTAGNAITFTQAMTLDASGNLGIGATSPSKKLHLAGTAGSSAILLAKTDSGASTLGQIGFSTVNGTVAGIDATAITDSNNGALRFWTTGGSPQSDVTSLSERARIDSAGHLLVGTTDFSNITGGNTAGIALQSAGTIWGSRADASGVFNRLTSNGSAVDLRRQGVTVGSISVTTTATTYNTSSDYRLKENVAPMQNALDTVAQLNPVTYTWKVDGSAGQGFIAHELQAVVPDCVTGEKDAVDAEGNPQYQGVDTSFLVATLVAAIKELKAEVDSLKAQLEAK